MAGGVTLGLLRSVAIALALGMFSPGCAAQEPLSGVANPALEATPRRKGSPAQAAPPPGPARPVDVARPVWAVLSNGLRVATLTSNGQPMVQLRVVVLAGRAADGDRPELAAVTAELLRDGGAGRLSGRDLLARVENMRGELKIETRFDASVFALAVRNDRGVDALALLGAMVTRPRLPPDELDRLKERTAARLTALARTGGWSADMMLYKDLFALPAGQHPYGVYNATPTEVSRITAAEVRAFHTHFYAPANAFVVVAGDVTPEAAKQVAQTAFGGWAGGAAPALAFDAPPPREKRTITLVDEPGSTGSLVHVATLGPERRDPGWAAFAVAHQVLGGGWAGRLQVDLRDTRSLADATGSFVFERARGPSVWDAWAATATARTGLVVAALLEHRARLSRTAPDDDEVVRARRFLAEGLTEKRETLGGVADEVVRLGVMGLPDDDDSVLRREIGAVTPALALEAARAHVKLGREVIVVAGDAAVVGPMLTRFGDVEVLDPIREFARKQTLPRNPDAPLEVPREPGG